MDRSGDNPFKVASMAEPDNAMGRPVADSHAGVDPAQRVRAMMESTEVFLLIKGTPQQPQCGFSANTVAVMDAVGVPYRTFDVLSDEGIRAAAKTIAGWPTFPQVYVRGEFIGGNDIVTEMYHSGELQRVVEGTGS